MRHEEIRDALREFVIAELLEGEGGDLTAATPLVELKLIDSLSTVLLVSFIEKRFGLEVPLSELTTANLQNLGAITELVLRLGAAGAA